tara:strand:- start:155 stop:877 length:723 start_codon:yes stop_codon:yes gene_type:complete
MSEHEEYLSDLSLVSLRNLQEQVKLRIREVAELQSEIKVGDIVRIQPRTKYNTTEIGIVIKVNKRKYRVLCFHFFLDANWEKVPNTFNDWYFTGELGSRFKPQSSNVEKELVSLYDGNVGPDDYNCYCGLTKEFMDELEKCKDSVEYGFLLKKKTGYVRSYNPRTAVWKEWKKDLMKALWAYFCFDAERTASLLEGNGWNKDGWESGQASDEFHNRSRTYLRKYHDVMHEILEEITGVEE